MIFLHIGLNKAGSSAIQAFCDRHRTDLLELGIDYPADGVHEGAHYGLSKRLIGRPEASQVSLGEGLDAAVRASLDRGRTVLLSSEYFCTAGDPEVERVHELMSSFGVPTRILIYLRRHDEWIESLFNQALKTVPRYAPWQSDIRDFTLHLLGSRDIELRFPVILDRWARCFGERAMIVRPFEAVQFVQGDFIWDFLAQIDARLPAALQDRGCIPRRVNESKSEAILRAVDAVRASGIDPVAVKATIASLLRAGGTSDAKSLRRHWDGRLFELTPPLRKAIQRIFADDYRYVEERYLEVRHGALFKAPMP